MKKTKPILREIESTLGAIGLFMIALKSFVITAVCFLIMSMFGVNILIALIPGIVYFFSSLAIYPRIDKVRTVERKYSHLDEKLRTARDYINKDNVVLESLDDDIEKSIKEVKISKFVSIPDVAVLVILLIVCTTVTLFLVSEGIRIMDFNEFISDTASKLSSINDQTEAEEGAFIGEEKSIMQVGSERIEVEIKPVGMDLDFNELSTEADYEFGYSFPKDAFISGGASYEEEFSEEQRILIEKYFEKKKSLS